MNVCLGLYIVWFTEKNKCIKASIKYPTSQDDIIRLWITTSVYYVSDDPVKILIPFQAKHMCV